MWKPTTSGGPICTAAVIKTVEASANFEKCTFERCSGSQGKTGSVTVNVNDQASLDSYQQAQGQMRGAFSNLLDMLKITRILKPPRHSRISRHKSKEQRTASM